MGVFTTSVQANVSGFRPIVHFDANAVTIIGQFSDELSAYRVRKFWCEILSNYFLLETKRDYEMSVRASLESGQFTVDCSFTSACGRYAFWRLINNQAPEAEEELCLASSYNNRGAKRLITAIKNSAEFPWVVQGQTNVNRFFALLDLLKRPFEILFDKIAGCRNWQR